MVQFFKKNSLSELLNYVTMRRKFYQLIFLIIHEQHLSENNKKIWVNNAVLARYTYDNIYSVFQSVFKFLHACMIS